MKSANRPQFLLFLALFNSVIGLSILFPILAPLGRQLELSEVQVGWLSTVYSLMQFVASPIWGRMSERRGRRPVLLLGIFGFAVGFAAFGALAQLGVWGYLSGTPLLVGLLGARALGGFLSSATMPTAQAYIADITDRSKRASGMALVGAAFGLGIVFGPGLGALLSHWGLLVPIFVSVAVAIGNGMFVWLKLPETPKHEHLTEFAPSAVVLARVWPVLGVGFSVTLASVAMEQTVAFLFQDALHLDGENAARHVGLALVSYGILAVFAQGYVVRKLGWSPFRLLLTGLPLTAVGLLGLVFSDSFLSLTVAVAVQGLGQGLAVPGYSAAVSLGVGEREQGEAAGLNSAAQALGRTLGPIVGAMFYRIHERLPYAASIGLITVVLLAILASPALRRRVAAVTG